MEAVLTIIDTAGIQEFIFGSNRLRENVGASFLVELATHDWVYKELQRLGSTNLQKHTYEYNGATLEENDLVAELIYAGGGNTVILFRSLEAARVFTQRLTRRVLRHAPGLGLVVTHSEFEWEPQGANFYRKQFEPLLKGRLTQKKCARLAAPLGLPGLGVTAECSSTGFVAAQRVDDPEPRIVSREVGAKVNKRLQKIAKQRLRDLLDIDDDRIEFSDDLDHLGRKGGEESYIAVVHLDGNEAGKRIKEFVSAAATNRETVNRMRDCSKAIIGASNNAFRAMFDSIRQPEQNRQYRELVEKPKLKDCQPAENIEPKCIRFFQDESEEQRPKYEGKPCWPFRPLVLGGDDITFVCNGQLGLSLAVIFMRAFETFTARAFTKLENPEPENQLQAAGIHTAAGIAIVKTHYPFQRAYELSEALTRSAKRFLREKGKISHASALDWHISSTGLGGSLETIRRREYQTTEGSLQMRPIWLAEPSEWRTWESFNDLVATFNYCEGFAERRNKLKALRSALREGKTGVKRFLESFRDKDALTLPVLHKDFTNLHTQGWEGGHCGYFDALEAMDHHFLLEGGNDE